MKTNKAVCYLDTNAYMLYYLDQQGSQQIRGMISNSLYDVWISNLTFLEFLGKLLKLYRKKQISKKLLRAIVRRIRRDIGTSDGRVFSLLEFPVKSLARAESILLSEGLNYGIQVNDAIHLSIALFLKSNIDNQVCFSTFDNSLRKTSENCKLDLFPEG